MEKRTRVAVILQLENGIALIHRTNVKDHPIGDYYTIPGGEREKGETLRQTAKREIQEELGIHVKIGKQIYYLKNERGKQYFFEGTYLAGTFGTGTGPEFSNNPDYAHRGNYIPEEIPLEKIKDIPLLPTQIKEKLFVIF